MFLADAVVGYVESLSERELDAPLVALLHSLSFDKVHLVHGQYEFGRDFIAQRDEDGVLYQYCVQSKVGDLGATAWREVSLQVEAMRTVGVVHPSFDSNLPRRLVVATTGRLKGGAGVEFQSYNEYHQKRGEVPAELWDIDWLAPRFVHVLVEGVPAQDRARTLEMLGRLGRGGGSRLELREFSQGWFQNNLTERERWSHVLGAAFLAKEAADRGREDLACQLAFLLIRAAWETPALPERQRETELEVARNLFLTQADAFWVAVREDDAIGLTLQGDYGLDLFVVQPVKAARLCECLSLLGLWHLSHGDTARAEELAEYVANAVATAPACARPISDEWSFSVLCTGLFLGVAGRLEAAEALLRRTAVWLLDRIEDGRGIATVGASPPEAVRYLLGPPYSHLAVPLQPTAYGFTVVLDLAHILEFRPLYIDLVNDLHALGAIAWLVVDGFAGPQLVARVDYAGNEDLPADHHAIPMDVLPPARAGAYFDCLASWATNRDRHLPSLLRHMLAFSRTGAAADDDGAPPTSSTATTAEAPGVDS